MKNEKFHHTPFRNGIEQAAQKTSDRPTRTKRRRKRVGMEGRCVSLKRSGWDDGAKTPMTPQPWSSSPLTASVTRDSATNATETTTCLKTGVGREL